MQFKRFTHSKHLFHPDHSVAGHRQVLKPESMTAKKLSSSVKRTSASSTSHHLQVPGPVPKGPKQQDHAKNNMAFDFSDEQVRGPEYRGGAGELLV